MFGVEIVRTMRDADLPWRPLGRPLGWEAAVGAAVSLEALGDACGELEQLAFEVSAERLDGRLVGVGRDPIWPLASVRRCVNGRGICVRSHVFRVMPRR